MKLILVILLFLNPINDLNKIKRANEHKKAAREAYLAGDYETAATHYRFLHDSLQINDENVLLNLANSLYKIQDSTGAKAIYNDLFTDTSPTTRSLAHQQLGLMDFEGKKYKESMDHYKEALRSDPGNEDARYNYELLKKILKEQEEQQQQQQDQNQDQDQQNQQQQQDQQNQQNQQNQDQQDQQNQDQQNQDQKNQENQENQENQQQQDQQDKEQGEDQQKPQEGEENKETPEQLDPTTAEKLEEMNISEEKAKMILEAMKNNEIQYLQQNRRKATKRPKSGKPDW